MAEMRTLIARYTAQPGRGDEVAELLKEMAAAVAADEPECLLYRAARLIDTPEVFILFEEYTSQDALVAHRETPHFQRLIEGPIAPLLDGREREIGEAHLCGHALNGGRCGNTSQVVTRARGRCLRKQVLEVVKTIDNTSDGI